MADIQQGKGQVLQPPQWLAEVGAVLTRLAPKQAISMFQIFLAMELPITTAWNVYEQACRLAVELNHYLFDTLYHAVALYVPDTLFVTADTRYFRIAAKLGAHHRVKRLSPNRLIRKADAGWRSVGNSMGSRIAIQARTYKTFLAGC